MPWPPWMPGRRTADRRPAERAIYVVMGSADLRGFLQNAAPDSVVVSDRKSPWVYGFSDVATEYMPTPALLARLGSEDEIATYLRGRLETVKFKWKATRVHAVGEEARAFLRFLSRKAGAASERGDTLAAVHEP